MATPVLLYVNPVVYDLVLNTAVSCDSFCLFFQTALQKAVASAAVKEDLADDGSTVKDGILASSLKASGLVLAKKFDKDEWLLNRHRKRSEKLLNT